MNVYAKYQWQNYGAANRKRVDGYRFKVKYFVPITDLWGGQPSHIGFTNFDWGSDLGDDSGCANNGIKTRTNNSIASSHILALNYDHWHYLSLPVTGITGGQWNDDEELDQRQLQRSLYRLGWLSGSRLQLLIGECRFHIRHFYHSSCSSSLSNQANGLYCFTDIFLRFPCDNGRTIPIRFGVFRMLMRSWQ